MCSSDMTGDEISDVSPAAAAATATAAAAAAWETGNPAPGGWMLAGMPKGRRAVAPCPGCGRCVPV